MNLECGILGIGFSGRFKSGKIIPPMQLNYLLNSKLEENGKPIN